MSATTAYRRLNRSKLSNNPAVSTGTRSVHSTGYGPECFSLFTKGATIALAWLFGGRSGAFRFNLSSCSSRLPIPMILSIKVSTERAVHAPGENDNSSIRLCLGPQAQPALSKGVVRRRLSGSDYQRRVFFILPTADTERVDTHQTTRINWQLYINRMSRHTGHHRIMEAGKPS